MRKFVFKRDKKKTWKEIRGELAALKEQEELEEEEIVMAWIIDVWKKKTAWKHIHSDIVSTVMLGNTRQHMYQR